MDEHSRRILIDALRSVERFRVKIPRKRDGYLFIWKEKGCKGRVFVSGESIVERYYDDRDRSSPPDE